jgi:hypothetical protein
MSVQVPLPAGALDFTGIELGNLKVVRFFDVHNDSTLWLCQCTCGNKVLASFNGIIFRNFESAHCGHTKFSHELQWSFPTAKAAVKTDKKTKNTEESKPKFMTRTYKVRPQKLIDNTHIEDGVEKTKGRKNGTTPGQKWNWLKAVGPTGEFRNSAKLWEFTCDCGTPVYDIPSHVKSGKRKSCGCLRKSRKVTTS